MFSKSNQQTKKTNQPEIEDLIISNSNITKDKTMSESDQEQSELVKLVEKISGILSPYFIVIVGLYLYDNNFFLGTILIIIGILSLLKISYQDIGQWIAKIKSFFNNSQEQ